MKSAVIEASNGLNWGKFLIARFDEEEWALRPAVHDAMDTTPLLRQLGWGRDHVWFLDLQTGEGAFLRPGGMASADLRKHAIWVCPLFEPFLEWAYQQDLTQIDALPRLVELPNAPAAFHGYRRPGPIGDLLAELAEAGVGPDLLEKARALLAR